MRFPGLTGPILNAAEQSRDTIAKMCRYTAPPGHVRSKAPERPKLGRLVPVIDAGCRVPELGGQLKPQTHVWTPEMTPKDDNTVAHITNRIDEACRELTKIADMLAGYPELDDTVAPLREVLAILEVRRARFDRDPQK
jgi:hypothetical protein